MWLWAHVVSYLSCLLNAFKTQFNKITFWHRPSSLSLSKRNIPPDTVSDWRPFVCAASSITIALREVAASSRPHPPLCLKPLVPLSAETKVSTFACWLGLGWLRLRVVHQCVCVCRGIVIGCECWPDLKPHWAISSALSGAVRQFSLAVKEFSEWMRSKKLFLFKATVNYEQKSTPLI